MKNTSLLLILALVILIAGCTQVPSVPDANLTRATLPLVVQCPPETTAQVQSAYTGAAQASGGSGIYQYRITGQLPYGVLMNGQVLQGKPGPNTQGNYTYQVEALDSFNETASATCSLSVNMTIYACYINGQIPSTYYTMNDCQRGCADPASCDVFNPPKPSNSNNLVYLVLGILVAVLAFLYFFGDVIFQSENFQNRRLIGLAIYKGLLYNRRLNEWTDHITGEWGFTFSHNKRKGDEFPVTNKTHAYGLRSCDKKNRFMEIIYFPEDVKKLEEELAQTRGENASLREQLDRVLNTDVFGLAVGISAHYKAIGENVHSVNVQPMNRSGQNYNSGRQEAPPDYG